MKKTISVLITLCLVATMLAGLAVGVSAADAAVWDGSVATAFAGGLGTEGSPYQIANGAQLAYMSKVVNEGASNGAYRTAHYKLTADITLNEGDASAWAETAPANLLNPIGIAADGTDDTTWRAGAFNGTFDGNGKTISGFYVSNTSSSMNAGTGLFAIVGADATVKNFRITNSYVSANKAAGVIGLALTSDNLSIDAIVSDISVNAVEAGAGGVVGQLSGNGGGNITSCVFMGNVNSAAMAGGILGNGNGRKINLENCLNLGVIKSVDDYESGILGRIAKNDCTIKNCISIGTARYQFVRSSSSSEKPNVSDSFYVGELNSKNTNVENCTELASVHDVCGENVAEAITSVLTAWTTRANDVMIPTAVSSFMPSTAELFVKKYTVTWKNADGTVLDTEEYKMGETPTYKGETPTKAEDETYTYTFSQWSPAIVPVTVGDATYTAEFFKTRKNVGEIEDETEAPETEAPETTSTASETTAPAEEKGGCGSVVGFSAIAIVAVMGSAAVLGRKKKED